MVHFANGRERSHGDIGTVREIEGGESGMLRLPLLDRGGRGAAPAIGVLRGYPRTLHEQLELRPSLLDGEPATPGAEELRRTLYTLPSHGMLAERDRAALVRWIEGGNGKARG